jgi:trimeric autotransporter adhesin
MTRSSHVGYKAGKLFKGRPLGLVGMVLLLGSGGVWAGSPNPTPSDRLGNTAGGSDALSNNSTGGYNTSFGDRALTNNTGGNYNTVSGAFALYRNTTGSENTASGYRTLFDNDTGSGNTLSGFEALLTNSSGGYNTTTGAFALFSNTTGSYNAAFGTAALESNITGTFNTAIGYAADALAGDITNGTAIGAFAELTASNSIVLGNNTISKIYANVTAVTSVSDRRRKKDIRALGSDLGLDFIKNLQPVSYCFNNGDETERYGFIAQELEQALPDSLRDTIERSEPKHGLALIERQNDKDRTYRVSYGELFAPIVNAIQQQQQQIDAERQQNAELRQALLAVTDKIVALQAHNHALLHSIETRREQITDARDSLQSRDANSCVMTLVENRK